MRVSATPPYGVSSIDSLGSTVRLNADLTEQQARRVVVDSSHHDGSIEVNGAQFEVVFPAARRVSGVRLVQASVPRCLGNLRRAVLTATVDNTTDPNNTTTTSHYLHAFAPETASLADIGTAFRASLEEDARRGTTGTFDSPFFQRLTIKCTPTGFAVFEFYNSVDADVTDVKLDVSGFDLMNDCGVQQYEDGNVASWSPDLNSGTSSMGVWYFSQRMTGVHRRLGAPYVCVDGMGTIDTPIPGGTFIEDIQCTLSGAGAQATARAVVDEGVIRTVTPVDGIGSIPEDTVLDVIPVTAAPLPGTNGRLVKVEDELRIRDGGSGYIEGAYRVNDGTSEFDISITVSRRGVRRVEVTNGGSGYDATTTARFSQVRAAKTVSLTDATEVDTHSPAVAVVTNTGGSITHVDLTDAGEGYALSRRPMDAFALLQDECGSAPFKLAKETARYFTTPLPSLSRLRVSVRSPDGEAYPIAASARTLFVFEIYCENP